MLSSGVFTEPAGGGNVDMQQDERGHAMTTQSAEAAESLDGAIHNFLHWKAALLPKIKAALQADPDFGFAHIVNGLILHGARNVHFRPRIEASLAAAKAVETEIDRKSTRLNSSHMSESRMPSSA